MIFEPLGASACIRVYLRQKNLTCCCRPPRSALPRFTRLPCLWDLFTKV